MTDLAQLDRLFAEGRQAKELTVLVARLPACALCQQEGIEENAWVDGRRRGSDIWTYMCRTHYAAHGAGLGLGEGQVLIPTGQGTEVSVPEGSVPIGYARLISEYRLAVLPPHRLSFLGTVRREIHGKEQLRIVLPSSSDPGPTLTAQLEFALKHEGLQLELLEALFRRVDRQAFEAELTAALRESPLGQYLRRLWFLYEWLTEQVLPVPDLTRGNYVPLLDPAEYYTGAPRRVRRQRINENLLGTREFSPMVRRTEKLSAFERKDLAARVSRLMGRYDADALRRAVNYLYTKETRSSFGIEGERPSPNKAERFVALLQEVPRLSALTKEVLVRIQNETVDPRFANQDYRDEQVYVAQSLGLTRQRIDYIAPKPNDVPSLMGGLLACIERLGSSELDAVVEAAVVSFGFVFIHPFSDGNGRLHRLLIHYILSRRGVTPQELIFPVSAVMESKRREYDECLESLSRPLMRLLDYSESEDGEVSVHGDSAPHYRYFDATRMAEDLYRWVLETIDTELQQELEFIIRFREAREAMAEVVDLPDRDLNLFVKLCRQNQGQLSKAKRQSHFPRLTDEEVQALEDIIRTHLLPSRLEPAPQPAEEEPPPPPKHTYGARPR